jgi:hypothetical protein
VAVPEETKPEVGTLTSNTTNSTPTGLPPLALSRSAVVITYDEKDVTWLQLSPRSVLFHSPAVRDP